MPEGGRLPADSSTGPCANSIGKTGIKPEKKKELHFMPMDHGFHGIYGDSMGSTAMGFLWDLPCGNLLHSYGESPFVVGKSTKWLFPIAM